MTKSHIVSRQLNCLTPKASHGHLHESRGANCLKVAHFTPRLQHSHHPLVIICPPQRSFAIFRLPEAPKGIPKHAWISGRRAERGLFTGCCAPPPAPPMLLWWPQQLQGGSGEEGRFLGREGQRGQHHGPPSTLKRKSGYGLGEGTAFKMSGCVWFKVVQRLFWGAVIPQCLHIH